MKIYSAHGINEFIICCGYKGHVIKEFFTNYYLHYSDVTFDIRNNSMKVRQSSAEPWIVTLVDTGIDVMTGGRIKRVREYIGNETFCLTYGDGVSDVNISEEIAFHREQGILATLTAVQMEGRFGLFKLDDSEAKISSFREKPKGDGAWINGGFFVLEPQVIDLIAGDSTVWEQEPMTTLAHEGQLAAYRHPGFWHCLDTLRDKHVLEQAWQSGDPPWKVW